MLDPSAALERFTVTPAPADEAPAEVSDHADVDRDVPCRNSRDTVNCATTVEQLLLFNSSSLLASLAANQTSTGRPPEELFERLRALGVDESTARQLVATHPAGDVRDALDAVGGADAAKPAGWVVAAVRGGWDIAGLAAEQRRLAARRFGPMCLV